MLENILCGNDGIRHKNGERKSKCGSHAMGLVEDREPQKEGLTE